MTSRTSPEDVADRPGTARRDLLRILGMAGLASTVFARAVITLADGGRKKVTSSMIERAEWISGLKLTDKQRKLMLAGFDQTLQGFDKVRAVALDNGVAPALRVTLAEEPPGAPEGGAGSGAAGGRAGSAAPGQDSVRVTAQAPQERPSDDDELAFMPLTALASLIEHRKISSVELTRFYLARLRRYDPLLQCVITYTEEMAMRQAEAADAEIGAGRYRGPLHGIPWGAKDLLAVPGYRTTWGATPYKEQVRPEKATVAARLEEAGAVLVAKTTVGELAWGDVWFGGTTKNPWKLDQGSSGSSAGSASATAAGCVGFAIGTETWGSIVSPCTRCGASGLRPTFGRVSRYGAMALSWSMDKIGPIARQVEDLALVFSAIHGPDGLDKCVADAPFTWPLRKDPRTLRVGFAEALFKEDYTKWADTEDEKPGLREWQEHDQQALETLRRMGVQLVPVKLPDAWPIGPLSVILTAEAATAFDELTRSGRDALLVRQVADAWPTEFRRGQMIPAVEYIRANRIRTLVMKDMERVLADVDVYVAPTYGGDNLLMTNLTGHPAVVVPNGFRRSDGTPTSITFMGRLYGETAALSLALAYQQGTDFHLKHPLMTPVPAKPAPKSR
jgi:Asp-tRNA(Asn)/Glu-tRNA(Gln) amidotransferase A subunit family amidase